MHLVTVASKVRSQIARFSGNLSAGLGKVAQRAVHEIVYGVHSRGSVLLSEIARSLDESVPVKQTIERLGRQLGRVQTRQGVQENLLALAAPRVDAQTLLILDLTDIIKPYAEKMQYLATVRDGSTDELGRGYECCQVVAAKRGRAEVVPLYQELYSPRAPDFVSENEQILRAIESVNAATCGRGMWVMDRGADRRKLFEPLLDAERAFLVRLRGDRHLEDKQQERRAAEELARRCVLSYKETVVRENEKRGRVVHLRFGALPVRLPERSEPLTLVVVRGFGKKPMMLLTSLRVGRSRASVWRIVESYLARWRVEETIRFLKQSYQLEDIRVLRYERLRTMAALVMACGFFTCAVLGKKIRLRILAQHILTASRRIFGIPEFRYYALADGIRQALFGSSRGPGPPALPPPPPQNLPLPFEA